MLEVKNLSKIYHSTVKNGADTHALDGVSLSFPEKGMVFLLGKSGSGKSTLLNVCGGLDSPTSGEIIVKGRSSKDFSQSDFDSYRNTYVGFIFQEYNILNEFSVEDNIALALELQGKPKDKKAIAELLEQVDLSGFAKRKPNTLSGGQKQRIAIARALVKSPEIIMADEPTGALDSATGKQVFDTLKKLSSDKLVIVVSHDREFAEIYADRIIELKDGRILSDVSKELQAQESLSANLDVVGEVLCVRSGSDLCESDFELIKKFLKSSKDRNVIIASGENDVANFKKVNKITDDGKKEVFCDTDESKQEKKTYTAKDSKFIRSKLPARHAAKIGISGLKTKPIRLFFTIILCVISFILFGILSTLSFYDSEAMFKQSFNDSQENYATFTKIYQGTVSHYSNGQLEHSYETVATANFSNNDIKDLEAVFGKGGFGAINAGYISFNVRQNASSYWHTNFTKIAYFPEGSFVRQGMIGTYPENDDEIAISKYIAEVLVECRTTDSNGAEVTFASINDVIGKSISIEGKTYKITAIFDGGEIDSKYEVLKDSSVERDYALEYNFENELSSGLHLILALSEDSARSLARVYGSRNSFGSDSEYSKSGNILNENGDPIEHVSYSKFSSLNESKVISFKDGARGENDVVLQSNIFFSMALTMIENNRFEIRNERDDLGHQRDRLISERNGYLEGSPEFQDCESRINELDKKIEKLYEKESEIDNIHSKCYTIYSGRSAVDKDGKYEEIELTDAEISKLISELLSTDVFEDIINSSPTVSFRISSFDGSPMTEARVFNVVGIYDSNNANHNSVIYLHESTESEYWDIQKVSTYYSEMTSSYKDDPDAIYNVFYVPFDKSNAQAEYLWDVYQNEDFSEDGSKLSLAGSKVESLRSIDDIVKSLSKVFLYVGLVLAAFAILLFSNFISVSISQKKREIGILRAVGARSVDVFKIFFSESFCIAAICSLISITGCALLCPVLNKSLAESLGASIFVFGILSIAVIIAIALLTAIVATFLPVWNAAKKKPVDSIRSL